MHIQKPKQFLIYIDILQNRKTYVERIKEVQKKEEARNEKILEELSSVKGTYIDNPKLYQGHSQ